MKVWWRSGHLPARRSDLRRRTSDGQTDDGRRAIALAHSWNELIITLKIKAQHKNIERRR